MSTFRQAAQQLAEAIDETMGEYVFVTPVKAVVNQPSIPHPEQTVRCVAVFTHVSDYAFNDAQSLRVSGNNDLKMAPAIMTRKPRFSFGYGETPWPLQRQFRIERCCDGTQWEITAAKPNGISRTDCDVVQLGRAKEY